ncbi:hypothetical protein HZB07_03360 [Candidatus Saganbacteria bacterium]|nr:hypothetical protein [Candidatus Saganbacteria bacterium]
MSYYYRWPRYVSAAEKSAKARRGLTKLQKQNPNISPVIIDGHKISKTWWGIAWTKNLESYADYTNRIGRGRSYVRQGAVLHLQIEKGTITALVQGSRSKPYSITITIKELPKSVWQNITNVCSGKLSSLAELLEGKFSKSLAGLFTAKDQGLFPAPKQIAFNCSCPDWAHMCKHIAATLYGVGARLDRDPSLFFVLRNIKIAELIARAVTKKSKKLLQKPEKKSQRIIETADMSAVFGIDIDETVKASPSVRPKKR